MEVAATFLCFNVVEINTIHFEFFADDTQLLHLVVVVVVVSNHDAPAAQFRGVVVTMKNEENIFGYFGQSFRRFIGAGMQRNENNKYGLAKTAYYGDIEWTNGTYRWFAAFRF